jgi:DNA-binding CsgD family transcriptional regulator
MDATQIVRDRAAEARTIPLGDGPLLIVSVLDAGMKHASVRRRLRVALSAIDHVQGEGVDMPAARLTEQIADWHAKACGTLVIAANGSTLVVEATEGGSALLLSEAGVEMLTTRERDVMRCVEDGLSNTEIARRLWIQPTTVRKHLEHVFGKLGVRSRTEALSKLHASRAEAS